MISPAFQYAVVAASSVPNQYSITPSNTLSFVSRKGTSASAVTSRHSQKSNPVLSLLRTFRILAYCLQYTRAKPSMNPGEISLCQTGAKVKVDYCQILFVSQQVPLIVLIPLLAQSF